METDYLQNVRERISYENHCDPGGDGRGFACACEDQLGDLGVF
jgi:hypothetical protein